MTANLIDGKEIAKTTRSRIKEDVEQLIEQGTIPSLTVILIGDDPASHSYVKGKERACEQAGITSVVKRHPESFTEAELVEEIRTLNEDSSVHGILVQLPLPKHIDETVVLDEISPHKDVDGFHPENVGQLLSGGEGFVPCTPLGIIEMLKLTGIEIEGKHAVIVGRSNLVGKPVGQLLLNENATVTYCHSKTKDLYKHTLDADILIAAVGRPQMIGVEGIKPGACVIDVGVNRVDGKLIGDVQFDETKEIAGWITPVPGGVGPMTITMLLHNTVLAAKRLGRCNDRS
ncbi:bifunctional methylenetetrahydrofolate dehydrogenase/methenyltetrahydrofolate cyclohydrolase FolD [Geomicrobium sediminis]|uniref:Bifunctional protein FolD n=1 Tax=Geomicrobium sediminis TaxID=1347788 RepID=A0ABS2PED2_9BACL|nr:bifunctional methylenetetrahydrofolate dehydrogenase/methenyltetrahydrofolate cyclohydrolase FolD [Geomicrobium sediminis]MBM7633647.1 methylenetetrahydrofolate dehydrogenase (NADP+)/methenyltetrahydrofolate cyclohydrolase [Geomicrobium sediminis]